MSDAQRRARVVLRHHLARTATSVDDVARGVTALHSSDPATPFLAAWARLHDFTPGVLDDAVARDRCLWRLHGMRRTLFLVPTSFAPVVQAAASLDIARKERRRLEGWLESEMEPTAVTAFLADLESAVLEVLADGSERRTQDLTSRLPGLATQITLGSGRWTTRSPLSSRLLFLMAMDGHIVRATAVGSWRSSQYRWAAVSKWFEAEPVRLDPSTARPELARAYLAAHGPATAQDLRWWTGWTARQTAAALDGVGSATVRLESGEEGLVLRDDTDPVPAPPPHAAFLPALDPTPMGWKNREWFLGEHGPTLFDRNGNIGPSVWADGRIVGGWAQRSTGEVVYRILEDVGAEAELRIAEEAASLTEWMAGAVAVPRFRTGLERELAT